MRIIITGAAGHMGRAVAEVAKSHGVDVACCFDPHAAEDGFVNDWAQVPAGCADALIDFSHPSSLPGILAYCARSPVRCGRTLPRGFPSPRSSPPHRA